VFGLLRPISIAIKPKCLRVERAIIFLRSFSNIDVISLINMDVEPMKVIHERMMMLLLKFLSRIRRKIPAVTRVDE
jgi:hypothetical protein